MVSMKMKKKAETKTKAKGKVGVIFHYIKQFKRLNFVIALLITLDVASTTISSIFLAKAFDAIVKMKAQSFIFWTFTVALLWIASNVIQGFRDVWKEKAIQKQLNAVRLDIVQALATMDYRSFRKNAREDYNSWLNNDMAIVQEQGFHQVYFVYEGCIAILFSAVAVLYFHWILLVIIGLTGLLMFVFPKIFEKSVAEATKKSSEAAGQALAVSTDYLKGFEVLYHNNQMNFFTKKIMAGFYRLGAVRVKLIRTRAYMQYSLNGLRSLSQLVSLSVSAILIFQGKMEVGAIVAVMNLSGPIVGYATYIGNSLITLQATSQLFDKYPEQVDGHDSNEHLTFEKTIHLKQLSVQFESGGAISFPDMELKKSGKYAIVGESGSGKSTLIQLLVGNLTDYSGQILLDDRDYRTIQPKGLQEIFSVPSQFPYIFQESIYENLTLGRVIEQEKVRQAVQATRADDFLEERLDTVFNANISGGQQARISLARELMGVKPILLMDESTASLDKETALAVEREILKDPDLTVIVITHHLYDETREYLDEVIRLG